MTSRKVYVIPVLMAILVLALAIVACGTTASEGAQVLENESDQQAPGVGLIITNQPVYDLQGYSWDRDVLIRTAIWRNKPQQTYSYFLNFGKIVELCPSLGFPIPYSTQLTSPEQAYRRSGYSDLLALPQPEPDSLYRPESANATYVMCLNPNGTVTPTYVEDNVMPLPFRIQADIVLQRTNQPTFEIQPPK